MIHEKFGNNIDRTEESLATQQAADKRLFDKMRQADDEKFHSRPEWYPMEDISDDYDWIRRGGAWGAF